MAEHLAGLLANPAWLAAFGVAVVVPVLGLIGNILAAQRPRPPGEVYRALPEHPLLLTATARLSGEDRAVLEAILARLAGLEAAQARMLAALDRVQDRLDLLLRDR